MIKQYKGCIIFFYVAAILSLIVGTFQDLNIDKALNNPDNPVALWFYATGEIPSRLTLMLAGLVIFYLASKTIVRIIGLAVEIGGGIFTGVHLADYLFAEDGNEIIFGAVFGIGIAVCALIIGKYITIPDKMKKPLVVIAFAGIAVFALETGITEGVKIVWGRERMRMLLQEGSFDNFTPWYKPQGITSSNEYKSFPSGHTSGAAVSYLAMLLPFASDKARNKKVLCFALPFVYTSIVAFTRMMMGAHFLTDVTCGAIITFTVMVCAMAVIDKKARV